MFFALLLLWILLNARISIEIVLVGVVLSAMLTWFGRKYCRWSARADRVALRLLRQVLAYAGQLFIEILLANIAVLKIICSPKATKISPTIFFFDGNLTSNPAKFTLANSITITPGTYTIGLYDSTLAVHALTEDFAAGTPDSALNRRLCKMEETCKQEANK